MTHILERWGTAIAGLALIAFFMIFASNFASPANLINIVRDTSFLAILALGFALALTAGELDLSIAEVASLSAVVAGGCIQNGLHPAVAVLAALSAGTLLGAFNGFCVTRLLVPSLIVTLATAAIARGVTFMVTQGVAFVGRWPTLFTGLARNTGLGVPNLVWCLATITCLVYLLLKWTRIGAHMIATGEADEAAHLAGIATRRMKRLGLTLSGLFAGLTGVLLAANLSSASPNMAGDYFLYAIAAVLLGMTMFEPGRPNVAGTVFAAIVLKVLGNGLILLGTPYYVQDIMLGGIMIASVAFSSAVVKKVAFKV
jgi:ribose transport system permease protein